eukprot:749859-Hanusia_phi.AAC.1
MEQMDFALQAGMRAVDRAGDVQAIARKLRGDLLVLFPPQFCLTSLLLLSPSSSPYPFLVSLTHMLLLLSVGELGIGNTTTAAAIVSAFSGSDPQQTCGKGTGLDPGELEESEEEKNEEEDGGGGDKSFLQKDEEPSASFLSLSSACPYSLLPSPAHVLFALNLSNKEVVDGHKQVVDKQEQDPQKVVALSPSSSCPCFLSHPLFLPCLIPSSFRSNCLLSAFSRPLEVSSLLPSPERYSGDWENPAAAPQRFPVSSTSLSLFPCFLLRLISRCGRRAHEKKIAVLVDGFISSAAALAAVHADPDVSQVIPLLHLLPSLWLCQAIFLATRSAEIGHQSERVSSCPNSPLWLLQSLWKRFGLAVRTLLLLQSSTCRQVSSCLFASHLLAARVRRGDRSRAGLSHPSR